MTQPNIQLDTCCQNILILLAKSSSPLTSREIADDLGVTGRIVQYRLERVERWLELKDIRLIKKPGEGISLGLDESKRQQLVKDLTTMHVGEVFLTPTERLQLMILSFLFSDEPLVVKQFEQQLHVSRTTILKDLETIDAWLSARQLVLTRRPNFGCLISGTETKIRAAIVDALLESVSDAFSNRFEEVFEITENQYKKTETAFRHNLVPFLTPLELRFFYNLVSRLAEENKVALRESAYLLLVFYLAIVYYRLLSNHVSDYDEISLDPSNGQRNLTIANQFSAAVKNRFQVHFTKKDVMELVGVLHRSQEKTPEFGLHELSLAGIHEREQIKRDFEPEVIVTVDKLLERASTYLHPSLRVDTELTLNLANHLSHLYKYPGSRIPIRNPLLADLKKEYPYIYKVAKECSDIINQEGKLSLQEDEIGYIAMYMAAALERMCIPLQSKKRVLVVCNAGGATASLLVSRIRSEFPDMEIVGVMSKRELTIKKNLLDFNFVICTIPLDLKDVPFVVVSPLLNKEDIHKIQDIVHTQVTPPLIGEKTGHISSGQIRLSDLLTQKTIHLKVEATGWENVVDKAGTPLLELKAIEPRYITAMKDVIKQCGPYMVIWPGVVLLHARPDEGVNRLCMSLITLKEPVPFGLAGKDPVFIALVLGAVNNNSHLNALFELNALMQDPFTINSLRTAATPYQVRSLISKI
jgi:mannitol operon transcriptional antiterminator